MFQRKRRQTIHPTSYSSCHTADLVPGALEHPAMIKHLHVAAVAADAASERNQKEDGLRSNYWRNKRYWAPAEARRGTVPGMTYTSDCSL